MADNATSETQNKRPASPLRWFIPLVVVALVVVVAGVLLLNPGESLEDETPPEPTPLLARVVENMRDVDSFQLLIEQQGAAYPFVVSLDEGASTVTATMRRGDAQYVSPDTMYANVNLRISALPVMAVELYADGLDQWFKLANQWIHYPIAEGFNPGDLIAENGGFSQALGQLDDVAYIGSETLIDGTQTWHIQGQAGGQVINDLLFNLLYVEQDVIVDVFIDKTTSLPAVLEVTLPGTATEDEADTAWHIEIYDYNGEVTFDAPNGTANAES
ncbi:LppX_LprAFG lipoprotein [Phototrophicus methaneseepsis]|uniref:LppX_LprAFG lipoprotein n=1 Tax=Phototrophicus methaneseepsis TaxID=2710758 RepID=A0A7S8EA02_9CHLR|nr:LppX_LprAFG lipoprotein [Phototrophicus methaneseepsis]QPC82973.1 LppX_LprAFG lipoprotein [Phototrophicus methaneseepsis]